MVAMLGKELTITERACGLFERLLLTAVWGIQQLARFTLFAKSLTVVLPHAAELACLGVEALQLCIQAKLIQLG
ncbi:MAG: hypothetical protein AAF525_01050, partial [Pseudomonadota bacterium]